MDLLPGEDAFIHEFVPEGAIPVGYVAVIAWIEKDSGRLAYKLVNDCDFNVAQAVGLLELGKLDLLNVRMDLEDDE